ncbi:MAG: Lrp/AsnC family transcriptional regulator, partial [Desulfovibrio sp.]|nr:Lrp/AsnC family transcriptional regulator [Desulfovibrio sp.]
RALLDIIQTEFPIDPDPYAILGARTGIAREEAFRRVRAMRKSGFVRRLGANFQSGKLGFASTLCAAAVPEHKKEAFIAAVNALPGVTHNYERDHAFNIWFTLISPSREAARELLARLAKDTGVEIMDLPATRLYKIRVDFPMRRHVPD